MSAPAYFGQQFTEPVAFCGIIPHYRYGTAAIVIIFEADMPVTFPSEMLELGERTLWDPSLNVFDLHRIGIIAAPAPQLLTLWLPSALSSML
jgi:hypothetical protein